MNAQERISIGSLGLGVIFLIAAITQLLFTSAYPRVLLIIGLALILGSILAKVYTK